MLYSTILLTEKLINEPHNSELMFDYNDTLIETMRLCNFFDTMQGIVFLNVMIWAMDKFFDTNGNQNPRVKMTRWIFRIIDYSTYIDDIVDLSSIVEAWGEHHDPYNKGRIAGKLSKMLIQMYL